nr:beta-ketoacyl synthase N-terminal-like domain-containing protein [uncultured Roseibium sp.]
MNTPARIVGMGAVTGYGFGISALMQGLATGVSAVNSQRSGEDTFPDGSWFARIPLHHPDDEKSTRFKMCFDAALEEAVDDASRRGWRPGRKVALVHGTACGDVDATVAVLDPSDEHIRRRFIAYLPSTSLVTAAEKHSIHGPVLTVNGTCATGLFALAVAHRLLMCGDASDVIVSCTDVGFSPVAFRGLGALGVLHTDRAAHEVTKPLSRDSLGFVSGEGAACLILSAGSEGKSYMNVLSTIMANDGYHPISIEPTHTQITAAMQDSLSRAQRSAGSVKSYITHGTGTAQCNAADMHVLGSLPAVKTIVASKPFLGHCLSAAALLETIIYAWCAGHVEKGGDILQTLSPHRSGASSATGVASGPALHMSLGAGGNIGMAAYDV